MINLIPPKGHASLKHEYLLRVATVYGFVLTGVFVAGTLLTIPTYVLVSSQLNAVRPDDDHVEEVKQTYNDALLHIQKANTIMAQLRTPISDIEISTVVEEIIRVAPSGVSFNSFQATREEGRVKSVSVQGKATTRNALASLKGTLEESPVFETANIPISDLARENNLPFEITIVLKSSDAPK